MSISTSEAEQGKPLSESAPEGAQSNKGPATLEPSGSDANKLSHVPAIDGLRAWMAWWVVCQHVLQLSGVAEIWPNALVRFLTMGGMAVIVFVVISGYVISQLCYTRKESYGVYITRRASRIYPVFLLACMLSLFLKDDYISVLRDNPLAPQDVVQRLVMEGRYMLEHLFAHSFLIHGIFPDQILPYSASAISGPAWSLSLEWQFYLIAPFIVSVVFSKRSLSTWVISLILIVAQFTVYMNAYGLTWEKPSLVFLLIGFFLVGISTHAILAGQSASRLLPVLAVVGVNVYFYATSYAGGHVFVALFPLLIWLGAIFLVKAKYVNNLARNILHFTLENKFAVNIGAWSYSTYLLHIPIFIVALKFSRELGVSPTPINDMLVLCLSCVPLLIVSAFSYHFVERAGTRLGSLLIQSFKK